MNKMKIMMININDIKEYENNPRNNEPAVKAVANSIKSFGFKVQHTRPRILFGHG